MRTGRWKQAAHLDPAPSACGSPRRLRGSRQRWRRNRESGALAAVSLSRSRGRGRFFFFFLASGGVGLVPGWPRFGPDPVRSVHVFK